MFVSDTTRKQSIFHAYINDIVTELTHVNNIVQPAPINLHDCVASLDSLQRFIHHCLAQANVDLSETQTLLKMDQQLFTDLIQPALIAKITANASSIHESE